MVGERATVAKPIVQAGTRVICASDCFRASALWEAELTNIEEDRSKLLEQDVAQVILHCCIASQSIVFFWRRADARQIEACRSFRCS